MAPRILAFDVFGTVVDWHGSIVSELATLHPHIDGAAFARAWRAGYAPAMKRTMESGTFRRLDELHLDILRSILPQFNLTLTPEQETHLNKVWHRLTPWPDAPEALQRLKSKFIITTLSNGNISLLTEMAKAGNLPWDVILCAEVFRAYKPDERVYNGVGELFDLPNDEVMMVAAHHSDLDAAKAAGLQTAYIERPLEFGADQPKDVSRQDPHPLHFKNLAQLADHLGCN